MQTSTSQTSLQDIKDVAPADLRLDYHASEKHISLELHHAADFEDGTGGERMDIHRVLFIDTINSDHHEAAEELAIALCATVNKQPELMAKVKALAMAALPAGAEQ